MTYGAILLCFSVAIFCWMVHEAGHMIAWWLMGIAPVKVVVGFARPFGRAFPVPFGLGIQYDADISELSRFDKLCGAISGPLFSCAIGLLLLQSVPMLGLANIFIGVVQMLPIPGSDGWKLIRIMKGK